MRVVSLLEAHAITIETPAGRALVRELDLCLGCERVAVVGRNGVGKSTLLEVLAGRQEPASGRVRCDLSRLGYIAQSGGNWCTNDSVVEHLATQLEVASPDRIAQVLRAHRFPLALASRALATLSPGERVRAALICLTQRRPVPELLVLDEPTQDLDFVGLAALENVLSAWPGGLLLASHDAEFLEAVGVSRRIEL